MTAAIYYHPDGYSIAGPRPMGRQSAGESFLRAFLQHAKTHAFWVWANTPKHGREFSAAVAAAGRTEPVKIVSRANFAEIAEPGTLHYPDPLIARLAWQRSLFGHRQWSLTGITHTTASSDVMDGIADLLTAPLQPWDAIICTSTAVKDHVERILRAQQEYLGDRLGITRTVLPQFPVIPLGIHPADFVFTADERAQARSRIAATDDALVVLFLGRLSFHAKAHPLAMYQALERAAQGLSADRQVLLVECGWHGNESIANAYMNAALTACPNVRAVTLDGRRAEDRRAAWASADVFCSLSDNIQETFGITPVEAMAAGLPVVVSDWNGYRETVRDGIDGFRIPTLMSPAGVGGDLVASYALGIDIYDRYCGYTCMMVAVDVEAAASAFERLFNSADLRRRMGEAARQRVRETFDWAAIIPRYEELWAELAERRKAAPSTKARDAWPARMDPFAGFAGYPTRTLGLETRLTLTDRDAKAAMARTVLYRSLAMVNFADKVLATQREIEAILAGCEQGPSTTTALIEPFSPERRSIALRSIAFLVKLGVLKVLP